MKRESLYFAPYLGFYSCGFCKEPRSYYFLVDRESKKICPCCATCSFNLPSISTPEIEQAFILHSLGLLEPQP